MGRNPFNKTVHYERKQPKAMRGLGKLERKKDFLKRAHMKKLQDETTTYLRRKGAGKNPDEFNTKMQNMRLQGKVVIDVRPKEGESIRDVENTLLILKNAQRRLEQKTLIAREKRILYDEEGNAHEADPIDLVDASTIKGKIDPALTLEMRAARQKQIAEIQKEIRATEKKLQELMKIERSKDQRKKLEIKDEYGDVIATYYQNTRKK